MTNTTNTGTKYIITRGFGDALCHASLTRGCAWTDGTAERAMTFSSRSDAEKCIKFYAIDGAHVAPAV